MARTPLPSPLPSACLRFNREKKKMFRMKFPFQGSRCVELVCIQSTYQYTTKHEGCEALSAAILMLVFQAWRSRPERTHTSYLLIIYLWCIFTCSIVSISCYISHDIGIEISRTYSRYWYRYIPKISHDISRILGTIPNTTSKKFRTHTRGYASLPPNWLFTAYTYCCTYLWFPTHSISSRLN